MSDTRATFQARLSEHLDWFAVRGRKARFWWRDDDAVAPSAALDRMLALAECHGVDLALAVIPKEATEALAARLAGEPHAVVLQHGWQHRNFQRKDLGEKAAELGSRRAVDEVLGDLAQGRARLEALFGERFVAALVPPWNRIDPAVARRLPEIGLAGLSTFTFHRAPRPHQVQAHVDILKWKGERRFIGWKSAGDRFDLQLCRRRTNPDEPVGLLSHHLVHDEACFDFLDAFLAVAARHPGATWPKVKDLFAE
ncbi:polysaccharide deacetylase family protein [Polymorphum gilvum]|uniref:Glycosyl transferase family 28 n=1 Tax=Polymorphum gilvum (strain LMG 25793 / CGMCC 1.9160 / SL003B-26A1) TaxID=991905 RepID=F2J4G7_POLGS|nr:polysaccharide deacetylase family protein [Polymorphum gilvum]ADZ71109.1 hypothetical protein SL003B_2686 [Polymorphum gilvum SL003B-26A1]